MATKRKQSVGHKIAARLKKFADKGECSSQIVTKRTVPEWPVHEFMERAHMCATFLAIYGFITLADRDKIHRRMMKRVAKNGK